VETKIINLFFSLLFFKKIYKKKKKKKKKKSTIDESMSLHPMQIFSTLNVIKINRQ